LAKSQEGIRIMTITIWNPRWHDRVVLIAKYKVSSGENKIKFTKAATLRDKIFTMSGEDIRSYPLETNGKIPCYAVPLDDLQEAKNE